MIISCPYCGARPSSEFTYLGDAALMSRPELKASQDAWANYVYLRDNPMGPHEELWYHGFGCGAWLVVTRNTKTHEVLSVKAAKP